MKINTLFSLFAPKDVKFLPMLKEASTVLVQESGLLQELFKTVEPEGIKELYRQIKVEEVKGDMINGRILKALNETFITPFDREDIDSLADRIDDVNDTVNRAAHKYMLFAPESLPKCINTLAEIIHKGTIEIDGAVDELTRFRKSDQNLRQHYKEIKRLEEEADVVYETGIMNLFKDEPNPKELLKLKDIIQELEKTANKINNVGKVFKTIFVKYA